MISGARSRLYRLVSVEVDKYLREVVPGRLDQLSGQIDEVRQATVEVRRIVADDLDASDEASALLGRALAGLTEAVGELRSEVAELRSRLDAPA